MTKRQTPGWPHCTLCIKTMGKHIYYVSQTLLEKSNHEIVNNCCTLYARPAAGPLCMELSIHYFRISWRKYKLSVLYVDNPHVYC